MTRALLARFAVVVLAFAFAGVLAGVVWHALWTPPSGVAWHNEWQLDSEGAPAEVSGTGLYVVVSVAAGIVLGTATAFIARGHEVATLVAVALGSAAAAALMAVTGHALGPPDPRPLALEKPDLTPLPGDLRVEGRSPYVGFPAGAVAAVGVTFLATNGSRRGGVAAEPGG